MFWLFWACYGLSGLEVVLGLRRLNDGLPLLITTFGALSFLAGGLVMAAWTARSESVGLLVWVERLPDQMLQLAQLIGVVLVLAALFSSTPWGKGIEEFSDPAFMLGLCLTALAIFCKARPLFRRRWAGGAER